MSASSRPTSVASAALVAAYAAVAAWLVVGSLRWPLVHDAPIMHYIAWRIASGAVPYRDLFDMNFPGTYLIHLTALRAFGAGDAAWRAFDLAWLTATSLALAVFARPWGWMAAAGSALFFAAYHVSGGAWLVGQRDYFLVIFLVLGALGVARWAAGRGRASLAGGGLALGAGLVVKPHAVIFAAVLAVVVLVVGLRDASGVGCSLAIFVAALATVPALVAGWIAVAGGLSAWRDIVLHYLVPYYSRLGRPASWAFHRWHVWIPIAGAVGVAVAHAAWAGRFGVRHTIALLGVAYGVVHHVGQGKGWEYHLYPLAAFAGLLAFAELRPALAQRRWLGLPLAASLVLVVILLAQRGVEGANAGWIRDKTDLVRRLAGDLGTLGPGDTVQVLDTTAGGLHARLRLGATQPTRFLYDFHFFHDERTPEILALRGELMRDLVAHPPRFIVLFDRGWPVGGPERIARFPALASFLSERYQARRSHPGYTVYEKRHDP